MTITSTNSSYGTYVEHLIALGDDLMEDRYNPPPILLKNDPEINVAPQSLYVSPNQLV